VECSFSGRNDLLCKNKKFSGHAYFVDNGNYLYHGTLMVDVDMELLSKSLSPSLLKLQSKGIASVRSRVINLAEVNPLVTVEGVKEAMITAFKKTYGEKITVQNLDKHTFLPNNLDKIQNKTWIYGESPAFSISLEEKMFFGNVMVSAVVENGRIQQLKIYTDSLYTLDFLKLEKECQANCFK
jgi:lipoate---protein ligase